MDGDGLGFGTRRDGYSDNVFEITGEVNGGVGNVPDVGWLNVFDSVKG